MSLPISQRCIFTREEIQKGPISGKNFSVKYYREPGIYNFALTIFQSLSRNYPTIFPASWSLFAGPKEFAKLPLELTEEVLKHAETLSKEIV